MVADFQDKFEKIYIRYFNWACVTYHRARNKILEQLEANNE